MFVVMANVPVCVTLETAWSKLCMGGEREMRVDSYKWLSLKTNQ